jgi:hypothetical protein
MKTPKTSTAILQIKVTLIGSSPIIWRRILVPARLHLGKLHQILQSVMGWQTSHLHEFQIAGKRYSDPEFNDFVLDEEHRSEDQATLKLAQVAKVADRFEYRYDFGDGWRHELKIENILDPDPNFAYPICIGGEGACPPEDCGGIGGYVNLLAKLKDTEHPEYEEVLRWLGGFFDPKAFDPNHINREHLWRKRW